LMHKAENKLRIRLYVTASHRPGLDIRGSRVAASGMGKFVQLDDQFAGANKSVSPSMHRIRVGIYSHG